MAEGPRPAGKHAATHSESRLAGTSVSAKSTDEGTFAARCEHDRASLAHLVVHTRSGQRCRQWSRTYFEADEKPIDRFQPQFVAPIASHPAIRAAAP